MNLLVEFLLLTMTVVLAAVGIPLGWRNDEKDLFKKLPPRGWIAIIALVLGYVLGVLKLMTSSETEAAQQTTIRNQETKIQNQAIVIRQQESTIQNLTTTIGAKDLKLEETGALVKSSSEAITKLTKTISNQALALKASAPGVDASGNPFLGEWRIEDIDGNLFNWASIAIKRAMNQEVFFEFGLDATVSTFVISDGVKKATNDAPQSYRVEENGLFIGEQPVLYRFENGYNKLSVHSKEGKMELLRVFK